MSAAVVFEGREQDEQHQRGREAGVPRPGARHLQAVATRRDQAAFIALFDFYAPRVKAYMKRLGASEDAAEELVQEVMLAVWRKAGSYDPAKAAVSTWIFTIARNLRIDMLRRDKHPELDPHDPMLSPEPAPAADDRIEAEERQGRVRAALLALPKDQAEVIRLAFYQGKSHGEIAAALKLPLGTVKSRLRLASQRIRHALGGEAEEPATSPQPWSVRPVARAVALTA
jgi:RNA polymerase sigma-70 factor (ECF subfamily)